MSAPPPSTPAHTAAVLARARQGDEPARDALFAGAVPPLLTYVRVRLGDRLRSKVEPLDVVQDTFAAALPALADFEAQGPGSFLAWLCRIAERQIAGLADHFDAKKRRPRGEATPWSAIATRLVAGGTAPGSVAARRDEHDRLEAALAALGDDERAVVLLHFFEERPLRQVAAALGLSTTTAHRLVGRATARLGALLAQAHGATDERGAPPASST
ncbi:MAG: sigma-70 family RNA polymerase sigma factor [Planctomycetota bacterium]